MRLRQSNYRLLKSGANKHRYICFRDGKITSFTTQKDDFNPWLSSLFGYFNAVIGLALLFNCLLPGSAYALPQGYQVLAGDVQFHQPDANTLNITSSSNSAIVNYQNFNIGANETVNFYLPGLQSSILNSVLGGSGSSILGHLYSNGQVLLVNPAGINFGPSAMVNVGGLMASTLNIHNSDYLSGNYRFFNDPTLAPGSIINQGNLTAQKYAILMGSAIDNQGTIKAAQVDLVVGDKISLVTGDNLQVETTLDESLKQKVQQTSDAIANAGLIEAEKINIQTDLADAFYTRAVNNSGIIKGTTLVEDNQGHIRIVAQSEQGGALVENTGSIEADQSVANRQAGTIEILGDKILQAGTVKAQGVGGDIHLRSTEETILSGTSFTSARGLEDWGDAGTINIWSDGNTAFESGGILDIRGGDLAGNAGFVEVSALHNVLFGGRALGEARHGIAGSILIDPVNIFIQSGGSNPGSGSVAYTVNPGSDSTFDPSYFSGFATVNLQATNNITVVDAFSLPSTTSFTLSANNDININNILTVGTNATASTVTITADAANGSSSNGVGNITVSNTGSIVKQGSGAMTLSGTNVTLNGALDTGSGALTVNASNNLTANSTLTASANANMTLSADANLTGATANGVGDLSLSSTSSINKAGSGTLTLNGANITQDGTIAAGTGTITANASNNITLNNTISNSGANPAYTFTADANMTGAASNGSGDLQLTSNGSISKSGTGTLTLAGTNVTTNGTVNLGTGALIMNASNNITVNDDITGTAGSNPAISLTADANLTGAATNGIGNINITSTGSISKSGSGVVTLTAATMDLNGGINTGGGNASIQASQVTRPIELGGSGAKSSSVLALYDSELDQLNNANVVTTIGATTQTGGITLTGPVSHTRQLTLATGGSLTINGALDTGNRQLILQANTMDINAAVSCGSANMFLRNVATGRNFELGQAALLTDAEPNAFSITAPEWALLNTSGIMTIGQTTSTGTFSILGALTSNYDLSLAAQGQFSQASGATINVGNRNFTLQTNTAAITETISAGTGNIAIGPISTTRNIQIGGNAVLGSAEPGGALLISDVELALLTNTGTLTLGNLNNTSGTLSLLSAKTFSNKHLSYISGNAMTFGSGMNVNTSGGNKNITLTANTMDLDSTLNAGTGTVTLNVANAARAIQLGGGTSVSTDVEPTATALWVANPELANITAGTLSIGGTGNTNAITTVGSLNSNSSLNIIGGSFTNSTGHTVTLPNTSKTLTIRTDTTDLNAAIDVGSTGTIIFQPKTNSRAMELGGGSALTDAEPGTMNISNPEFGLLTAGTITVGSTSTFTNNVTFVGAISNLASNMSVATTGDIIQNSGSTITTNDKNLTLTADLIDINAAINGGTGTISLRPRVATTPIELATADALSVTDPVGIFRLSSAEMDLMTANRLTIGTTSQTGGISILGDYDLSNRFSLTLNQDANVTATNRFFNTGGIRAIDITATSGILNWSTTGNNRSISLGALSATGGITLSTTGNNSAISLGATTSSTTLNTSITTQGSNSGITQTGTMTVTGGTTITTQGSSSGISLGTVNGSNKVVTITTGGDASAIGATGTVTTGNNIITTQGATNSGITVGTLTASGTSTLSTQGTGSGISLTNLTATGGLSANTKETTSDIGITTLGSFGTTNVNVLLDAEASNLSIGNNFIHNGTGASTIRLNAGFSQDGQTLNNAAAILSVGSSSAIASGATKNLSIFTGGGTAFNNNTLFNRSFTFNNLNLASGGNNTPLDFSTATKPSATFNVTNLLLRTSGTGSNILTGGAITASGNIDILSQNSNAALLGTITSSGGASTSVRLGAGYSAAGSLLNSSGVLSLGTLSLTNNSAKDLSVWAGSGTPFSNAYFSGTQTYNALDLRHGGSANFGTSGSPLQTNLSSLVLQTDGNAYVNNTGSLTLGKSGINNGLTVGNTFSLTNNNNITTANNASAVVLNLTTSANNGNITLNNVLTATNLTTLSTHGTGGVIFNTNASITGTNSTVNITTRSLDMQGSSTLATGASGLVTLLPNATGIDMRFADAAAGTGTLDINNSELSRITTGTLQLGNTSLTGGLTQAGNLNTSSNFNLLLANGGHISTSTGGLTLGAKNLTVDTPGTVTLGDISGTSAAVTVNGAGVTFSGTTNISGAGSLTVATTNNGNIAVNNTVTGGNAVVLNTNGTGNVTVATAKTLGTVSGGALSINANDLQLSGTGSLSTGATGSVTLTPNGNKNIHVADIGTGTGVFDINSSELGHITTGTLTIGSTSKSGDIQLTGDIDLTGQYNLTLANGGNITGTGVSLLSSGNTLTLNALGDVILSSVGNSKSFDISSISANRVGIETNGANSYITLNNGFVGTDLTLRTLGSASALSVNGNITTSGSLDLLTQLSNLSVNGNITSNGLSGTTTRIAAGYDVNGNLTNASASASLANNALSLVGNSSKSLKLWNGGGSFANQNNAGSGLNLNILDLRYGSAIDIGSSGTPFDSRAAQLILQTLGNAWVNQTGMVTLGAVGSSNTSSFGGGFTFASNESVSIANSLSANQLVFKPLSNASVIQLGDGLGGGSGILSLNNASLANLSTNDLSIGSNVTTGQIQLGDANFAASGANLTLNTTGAITDAVSGDLGYPNITMASGKTLTITGGAIGTGSGQIGGSGILDLDVSVTGAVNLKTQNAGIDLQNTQNLLLNQINSGSGNVQLASEGSISALNATGNKIITTGSLGLSSNGSIGTGGTALNIDTGALTISSTGGNSINLNHSGNLSLGSITTGAGGNITLNAAGGIAALNGTGTKISTTGLLNLASNGSIGTGGTALNIDTGAITVNTTGGNLVNLSHAGNLLIDSISTGGGGNIQLNSSGPISSLNAIGNKITTTGTLGLTSTGSIGTLGTALNIHTGALTVSSTGGNLINLNHSGNFLVDNIATGGAGNIQLNSGGSISSLNSIGTKISTTGTLSLTSTGSVGTLGSVLNVDTGALTIHSTNGNLIKLSHAGNLLIDSIATGGAGDIGLNAAGSITAINGTGIKISTTGTLGLNSNGGIGSSGTALNVDTGVLTILGTNSNLINLNHLGNLSIDSIATGGAGNIRLTAGGLISGLNATGNKITTTGTLGLTSNGSIGTSGTALNINTGALTIGSTGGNLINLNHSGNLSVDSIATGGAGNITLTAGGLISALNATGNKITTTGTLGLTSNGSIGTSGTALNINTGALTIGSTSGNLINLSQAGDLNINSIGTGGAGNITLTSGGLISALNATGNKITTTGTLGLTSNGNIGASGTALNINTGALTIGSTGGHLINLNHAGNLSIDSISTGGAGNITLNAGGAIGVANSAVTNVSTAGTLNLTSHGTIGSFGTALKIDTGAITVSDTQNNGLYLTSPSTLSISEIHTGLGNIQLTGSHILDNRLSTDTTALMTTTGSIQLSATNGDIGQINNVVEVDTGLGSAALSATATGDIYLTETNGALSVGNIQAASSGTVGLTASDLTVASGASVSGNTLNLTSNSINLLGNLSAPSGTVRLIPINSNSTVGLDSVSGSYNLSNAELSHINAGTLEIGSDNLMGNLSIGSISLNSNLTLNVGGNITDDSLSDTLANITLGSNKNLSFSGNSHQGSGQIGNNILPIEDLNVSLSGTGKIDVKTNNQLAFINLTQGGYLGLLDVGNSGISLSTGNQTNLTHGSLLDGNGAGLNIVAAGNSFLLAGYNNQSTIGTSADALEVQVVGSGALSMQAYGTDNTNTSISITGSVSTPVVVSTTPPGNILTENIETVLPSIPVLDDGPVITPPNILNTPQTNLDSNSILSDFTGAGISNFISDLAIQLQAPESIQVDENSQDGSPILKFVSDTLSAKSGSNNNNKNKNKNKKLNP